MNTISNNNSNNNNDDFEDSFTALIEDGWLNRHRDLYENGDITALQFIGLMRMSMEELGRESTNMTRRINRWKKRNQDTRVWDRRLQTARRLRQALQMQINSVEMNMHGHRMNTYNNAMEF